MWFLEKDILAKIQSSDYSLEKQNEYVASLSGSSCSKNSTLSIFGDVGEITVKGVLTKDPDFLSFILGGGNTTYSDIINALFTCEESPEISEIVMNIDSGGGEASGMFDVIEAMALVSKPITARVSGMAASAAYGIASQADEIVAMGDAVRFGSVGTAVSYYVDKNIVDVTSTDAPNKRPDVTTEEGKKTVVSELDEFHALFVNAIARGRNTSVEFVNNNYGKGATFLSQKALANGMIDRIFEYSAQRIKKPNASVGANLLNKKGFRMDLETLQSQHPDTYAAALQAGLDKERDRVVAHLTLAEGSGDMKTAAESIKSGLGITETVKAAHMTASMNRNDLKMKSEDDKAVAKSLGDVELEEKTAQEDFLTRLYAKHNKNMGLS